MKTAISNSVRGISIAMWVFVGAAVAFAALAGYAFRLPAETAQFVERSRYEHTGAFSYSFQGQPSILYPDGKVGPVAPNGAAKVGPSPVYSKLTKTMALNFTYALKSALPPQVRGEISVLQELSAGENGWKRSELIAAPAPFSGTGTTAHVQVDLASTLALIDAIEKETGASGGQYTLTFTPVVHVAGKVGAEAIDESYAPAFTVKLSKTLITPDSELAKSDVKKLGADVNVPADLSIGNLKLPVQTIRYAGAALAALCLLVGLLLGSLVYVGWHGNAEAGLKVKYGVVMVGVKGSIPLDGARHVEVAGMDDLGLLAQRDGQVVFSRPLEGGEKLYFVTKDEVIYTYTAGKRG